MGESVRGLCGFRREVDVFIGANGYERVIGG